MTISLFFMAGLLTGGCILFQVGLSYLIIALLGNFGLERSFRILAAVILVMCLVAAQAYFPTSYDEPQEKEDTTANSKGISLYFGFLKQKVFSLFLFANFVLCFAYSVSSVHQVSGELHEWSSIIIVIYPGAGRRQLLESGVDQQEVKLIASRYT